MWRVMTYSSVPFKGGLYLHNPRTKRCYPNEDSKHKTDFLWDVGAAQTLCDAFNLRDYGKIE